MKLVTLIGATLFCATVLAQSTVTVSTAPQSVERVFYRLNDDAQTAASLEQWDIAFETGGITGSVLVNTAKGIRVYKAPYTLAQWTTLDTAGLAAGWPEQHNSEIDWSSGALNQGLTADPFDLGWGIYNFVTHNIAGDSLFVFGMPDGQYKKFAVSGFSSTTNAFTFTMAALDGTGEQVGSLTRTDFAGKNFGYWSFAANATMDPEPPATDWDLLFTKYISLVPQPSPTYYPVVGVLQNREVEVLQVDGVPPADADWNSGPFSADINIIGYDWKSFNMTSNMYEYPTDRTYFVKDRSNNIWKLIFTAYGGSTNGNCVFTKELVSATGVEEIDRTGGLVLVPNPVASGLVRLVLDAAASTATLTVLDVNGRLVAQQLLTGMAGLSQHTLDVSKLVPGVYTLRLQGEGLNATNRLIVE